MFYSLKNPTFYISLCMHVMMILGACLFLSSNKSFTIGDNKINMISTYLYQEQNNKPTVEKEKIAEKNLQKNITLTKPLAELAEIALHKVKIEKKLYQQVTPSHAENHASQGQKTEALISLLHEAIQKQQHYPASALSLERQGRITLQFVLYKNGEISDLKVVKSSGTESLDSAALAAVHDATPFTLAAKYIHNAQEYNIDVVFELT